MGRCWDQWQQPNLNVTMTRSQSATKELCVCRSGTETNSGPTKAWEVKRTFKGRYPGASPGKTIVISPDGNLSHNNTLGLGGGGLFGPTGIRAWVKWGLVDEQGITPYFDFHIPAWGWYLSEQVPYHNPILSSTLKRRD